MVRQQVAALCPHFCRFELAQAMLDLCTMLKNDCVSNAMHCYSTASKAEGSNGTIASLTSVVVGSLHAGVVSDTVKQT
jgi:hypothetical protein